MKPRPVVAAFVFSQMLAAAVFAQAAGATSEFGRVSAGDLDLITKHSQKLSGSLDLTAGAGRGFGATLGGTLVKDRVWFFASAERSTPMLMTQSQLGERQNLATSFAASKTTPLPSSFLSLHYTGIVSSNMFVTASFSELRRSNATN